MTKPFVAQDDSSAPPETPEELIATFGEARLVRTQGRLQLHGGAMADRLEALDWISMFMPGELVNAHLPRRG